MHPAAKAKYVAELAEGNRRAARNIECATCGAPCLQGDDDDRCARIVTVDAEPLHSVDEMLHILNGRRTYDLVKATGKTAKPGAYELHARYDWHYTSQRVWGTTHVEHQCERQS